MKDIKNMYRDNPFKHLEYNKNVPFGIVKADGFKHTGIDLNANKGTKILCFMDGVVVKTLTDHKYYGNCVYIEHNLKYIDVNVTIYSLYAHLYSNVVNTGDYVRNNMIIGTMGNSGNTWTYDNNAWRPITDQEKNDVKSQRGVHTHFSLYTTDKADEEILKKNVGLKSSDIFFEHNKLWINPLAFIKQLEK